MSKTNLCLPCLWEQIDMTLLQLYIRIFLILPPSPLRLVFFLIVLLLPL
jgi:hypothetical protein